MRGKIPSKRGTLFFFGRVRANSQASGAKTFNDAVAYWHRRSHSYDSFRKRLRFSTTVTYRLMFVCSTVWRCDWPPYSRLHLPGEQTHRVGKVTRQLFSSLELRVIEIRYICMGKSNSPPGPIRRVSHCTFGRLDH